MRQGGYLWGRTTLSIARKPGLSAMAAGVRQFYDKDPDALGRTARGRAESEYSWGTAMGGLLGLYRGALVSGSESAPGYATP